jgi:hypothetical protein
MTTKEQFQEAIAGCQKMCDYSIARIRVYQRRRLVMVTLFLSVGSVLAEASYIHRLWWTFGIDSFWWLLLTGFEYWLNTDMISYHRAQKRIWGAIRIDLQKNLQAWQGHE